MLAESENTENILQSFTFQELKYASVSYSATDPNNFFNLDKNSILHFLCQVDPKKFRFLISIIKTEDILRARINREKLEGLVKVIGELINLKEDALKFLSENRMNANLNMLTSIGYEKLTNLFDNLEFCQKFLSDRIFAIEFSQNYWPAFSCLRDGKLSMEFFKANKKKISDLRVAVLADADFFLNWQSWELEHFLCRKDKADLRSTSLIALGPILQYFPALAYDQLIELINAENINLYADLIDIAIRSADFGAANFKMIYPKHDIERLKELIDIELKSGDRLYEVLLKNTRKDCHSLLNKAGHDLKKVAELIDNKKQNKRTYDALIEGGMFAKSDNEEEVLHVDKKIKKEQNKQSDDKSFNL